MSGVGPFSDLAARIREVRSTPNNGHRQLDRLCPKSANNGLMHRSKQILYSTTPVGLSE